MVGPDAVTGYPGDRRVRLRVAREYGRDPRDVADWPVDLLADAYAEIERTERRKRLERLQDEGWVQSAIWSDEGEAPPHELHEETEEAWKETRWQRARKPLKQFLDDRQDTFVATEELVETEDGVKRVPQMGEDDVLANPNAFFGGDS